MNTPKPSPTFQGSKNEQPLSAEDIADFFAAHFGITMAEQIQLPMENEKTEPRLPPEAEKKGESPLNASLRPSFTPEKRIKKAYSELNDKLADDLLKRIMDNSPWFFERLVVKLLLKYGIRRHGFQSGNCHEKKRGRRH